MEATTTRSSRTAAVPSPEGARLLRFSVTHSLVEELFIASFCGLQTEALDQESVGLAGVSGRSDR